MYEFLPTKFYLSQNYPNPFSGRTTIKYCVPDKSSIKITVLDVDMRIISEMKNEVIEAGTYEVEFDGNELPGGVYFYELNADNFVETKKMILLR